MAKRLTWSVKSVGDRRSIFNYWDTVNKSNVYSLKLDALFEETSKLLLNLPYIGKSTNKINIRFVVIRNYSVFY